jgi:glycosyltransferase involved in cell wall biosynthesis
MKVLVLTTSYPRDDRDIAGRFVADAVESLRGLGLELEVVSPADFPHFGIAYGSGIAQNLRAAPLKLLLTPFFMGAYARAARVAARDADVIHAHWLPSAAAALATGKPYLVQVWGTDVELARRMPLLARPLLRRARMVIAASTSLAAQARSLGAREVRVIPSGVAVPAAVGDPDEPPHVLFAGRLSREKGIREFLAASAGLPRVIVGDGPLRGEVAEAVGFVPPSELGAYYTRAAVVCVPSLREGYGMVAREAMAYERPVVATAVGGLADLQAGAVLVQPGEPGELREALTRLLGDAELRVGLGRAGAAHAREHFSMPVVAEAQAAAYREVADARRGGAT